MFEKSKLMLRYEKETGKPSTRMITDGCHCCPCIEIWHHEYVAWLESKIRTDNSFDVINHLTVDSRTDEIRQFMETGEGKDKRQFDFNKIVPMPENLKSSLPEFNVDDISAGYHWRKQNWGTRWNAYGNIQWEGNSISFKTAWNGVPELIRKLSLKFPDVYFHYRFSSENLKDQIGNMVFYNGISHLK